MATEALPGATRLRIGGLVQGLDAVAASGYGTRMSLEHDLFALAEAFTEARIRFAVAGGFAMALHGVVRATEDLDFVVDAEHVEQARQALRVHGYVNENEPWTTRDGWWTFHRFWKAAPGEDLVRVVDLMVPGCPDARSILESAQPAVAGGRALPVASKSSLRRMKSTRGSRKDLADLEQLGDDDPS